MKPIKEKKRVVIFSVGETEKKSKSRGERKLWFCIRIREELLVDE